MQQATGSPPPNVPPAPVALAVALAILGGVVFAGTAQSAAPEPPGQAGTEVEVLRGSEAVAFLDATGTTTDVAADAAMTGAQLVDGLRDDPLMFVTSDGLVGFTEPVIAGDATDGPQVEAALPAGVDVFDLHSRPSSGRVVFLDIDGHTTTGTQWNSSYGIDPIVSAPYDIDGNPSSFSTTEQERIYAIWQMVADDYAPFDIDVTTDDPGVEGLRKTWPGDTEFGSRVVITPSDWFFESQGYRIGGIAYVNVFSTSLGYPAFVFSDNLGSGNAKYVGEAASHEAGHNLGLGHDGGTSTAYYSGHGDWAPIMGSGYNRTITQWSRGEYAGANNTQDDLSIIAGHAPVAPDDHGDDISTATVVGASSTTPGVIAVGDVDVFTVTTGAGSLSATVAPEGTNLHASVTIRSAEGTVLAGASPTTALGFGATATTTVPAGTYVIEVEPVGWLTASTGFTSYASLGAYAMTIAAAAPDGTTSTTTTSTTAPPPATTTTTSTTTPPPATTATTTTTSSTSTTTTPTSPPPTSPPPTSPPPTSPPPTSPPPAADPTAGFVATVPERIVDTRSGLGGAARLGAGRLVAVTVAGRPGIPTSATAAVINVAAVGPSSAGFLSVFPCTGGSPDTSVLNYSPGDVVANSTIATLDASGRFCVWTLAPSDVLVDITGWLAPATGSRLTAIDPVRVADTRTGLGGATRLLPGTTLELDVGARVGASATAVALNITAVGAVDGGFLTAYPCGAAVPTTSTVNHGPGEVRPNNTIVGLGAGRVCIYSLAETDVLVDLVGHFGTTGLGYVPAAPDRLVDTRDAGAPLGAAGVVEYHLGSSPFGTPRAASVNDTPDDHVRPGFVSTYACGTPPDTSTLNLVVGRIAANGAIVPATPAGTSCAYTLDGGHLLVDLAGWWVTPISGAPAPAG